MCEKRISVQPLWGFSSSNPHHSQSRAEQGLNTGQWRTIYKFYLFVILKIFLLSVNVRLPLHPATPHWKTPSMAVRAIPLSVCRRGPPKGYQTGFKRCSDAQYLFNYQHRWHKCKSGWSLKTERIHLKLHVYIDTTHTIRHSILAWTSLYPFTFLKLNSIICGTSACFFFNSWLALLSELYFRHISARIKYKRK